MERDRFQCFYCGATPPEAVLCVDHVHPVVEGGNNSKDNLITACSDCNQGKTGTPLYDYEALKKIRAKLGDISKTPTQLELLI